MISLSLLRSAPVRLAFAFTAALAVVTAILFTYIYEETARLEISSRRKYLESEAHQAVLLPAPQLLDLVNNRIATDLRRNSFEELFDADGKPIIGNLPVLPADLPIDGLAHRMSVPVPDDPSREEVVLLVARQRQDGAILVLGRDLDSVVALQEVMGRSLLHGIVPALVLSLAAGLFLAFKALERIKRLHRTIGRIMNGDLHERLPLAGSADDLDRLASRINEMLDEILDLIEDIKGVGDSIAHDLRTPLSLMRIRLERSLIETDALAARGIVAQALDDLDHMHGTINSLLRIAEIENSRRVEFIKPTDLAEIAREVLDLYEPLAEEKRIALSLTVDGPTIIEADNDMLAEAAANIVDNAVKYTPAGGKVRISVTREDGIPLLRVHDSGHGIPAGERSKVTQRYYRAGRTSNARGNGLGLSLVAAIVKLHGFQLRIADVPEGACIEILAIPAASRHLAGADVHQ
jgi:signal transduction histidine kinase